MGETGWNQMARLGLQGNVRVCVRWKCVSQIEFFRAAWGLLWVLCQVSLQVLSRVLFQGNLRVFCFSSFFCLISLFYNLIFMALWAQMREVQVQVFLLYFIYLFYYYFYLFIYFVKNYFYFYFYFLFFLKKVSWI